MLLRVGSGPFLRGPEEDIRCMPGWLVQPRWGSMNRNVSVDSVECEAVGLDERVADSVQAPSTVAELLGLQMTNVEVSKLNCSKAQLDEPFPTLLTRTAIQRWRIPQGFLLEV